MGSFTAQEQEAITRRDEESRYWDELREVYRKISQGIARNNNRSGERAIWELLQNAGDLCKTPAEVVLRLTNEDLLFQHHGIAFTQNTLEDLIRQRSSKNDKTKVGRFGTGFMTTHVFNKKVYVSGSCLVEWEGKRLYLPFNDFCLNRDFDDAELFIDEADKALKKKKAILNNEGTEDDIYPTVFRYPIAEEKLKQVSEQMETTIRLMPYVLTFNDTIKECIIDNQTSFNKGEIRFTKINEENTICEHDSNVSLWKTYIQVSNNVETIVIKTLRNLDGTDRIVIPCLPIGYDDVEKIPSQFLFFPLLGSEDFGTNFVFHSRRLTPTEPRDSYELPKDNDNLTKVYKENESVLGEMFNMLFEYYRENPELQKSIPQQFASVGFKDVSNKRAADKIEIAYYEKLQTLFSSEISNYAMIPYEITEGEETHLTYTSINSGLVKVLDPQLLSLLTDDQITSYLPSIITNARKVAILPSSDVLGWSRVVASWETGATHSLWYVTLDQICAGIKANGDDLHDFLLLLTELGQTGTELMKKYALIPNREGVLCKLDSLRVGKTITPDLYSIAKPILRDKANVLVDISFEDVCDRTEYTRTNLRDDIGSAIDALRKETIDKSTNQYINYRTQSVPAPQLLSALCDTTTISDLVRYCYAYPVAEPKSLRADIMPVLSEFYSIEESLRCIPNEKTDGDVQPADIYSRAFNYLLDHTLYLISTKDSKWLTTDEGHDDNHDRLLRFLKILAKAAETNTDHMTRLKKYAVFPNQLGEMCLLNEEKFMKNEKIAPDFAAQYQTVIGDDLRSSWVDDEFKELVFFKEHSPKIAGKKMEDEKLRPYLEDKRKQGADFPVNESYENAMLTIVNHLEKGEWTEYFDFFANDTNLRNVSYELGTPKQKDALYRIKMKSNQETLDRLADIAGNPNVFTILDQAEKVIRQAEDRQRQFNFTFAIGKLIEREIGKCINTALEVHYSKSIDEFTASDEQNGQDIVVRHNGEPIYFIECKAKWNFSEAAHMSSLQIKQAVRETGRYALCCIDCTATGCSVAPDATEDEVIAASSDIIANTYIHTNIGELLKNTLESVIREEDAEAIMNEEERTARIGIYSTLSCNIPYKVFVKGTPFEHFLRDLRENLNPII